MTHDSSGLRAEDFCKMRNIEHICNGKGDAADSGSSEGSAKERKRGVVGQGAK